MVANIAEWLDKAYIENPDKIALVDENEQITYRQYHNKAVGIAHKLIEMGCKPKKPVVIYMNKSVRMNPSFMGAAYAGCFYCPIDVDMPESRVNRILEVLEPEYVITTAEYRKQFEQFDYNGEYIYYEDIDEMDSSDSVRLRMCKTIDTDVLYVFFTSGSTGVPKGVCVCHRGVVDYIDWLVEEMEIGPVDRIGNQAPFYFDLSVQDMYSCLKAQACLYIIPKNLFPQPVRLLQYIKDNGINAFIWVPSAMMLVSKLKAFRNVDLDGVLTKIMFCGEVMPTKQLNIWRKYLPNAKYVNLYGPTETVVASTYYVVEREFSDDESLPIGFPMKNTDVIILNDKDEEVTGPGEIGELCIRGSSVMPGYYANPEKTAPALVKNPLQNAYDEKIYRTGDLVEYNQYGEIEYICRKDFQIKHLGHRIELGEIETAVSSLEEVSACCCLYDTDHSRIVLFVDVEISKDELHQALKEMLPEYMLPGKVIYMPEMPHNANGKIDRVKLKDLM